MTDHAAEAHELIRQSDPALAQVHATLALAEQQRIANLIALAIPQKIPGQGKATISIPSYGIDGLLRADIASALGLTPTTPNQEQI